MNVRRINDRTLKILSRLEVGRALEREAFEAGQVVYKAPILAHSLEGWWRVLFRHNEATRGHRP